MRLEYLATPGDLYAGCRVAGTPQKETDPAFGRDRDGFGTKIHILTDRQDHPLHLRVTGRPAPRQHRGLGSGGVLDGRAVVLPDVDRAYDIDALRA